jgi:hypothetical protein
MAMAKPSIVDLTKASSITNSSDNNNRAQSTSNELQQQRNEVVHLQVRTNAVKQQMQQILLNLSSPTNSSHTNIGLMPLKPFPAASTVKVQIVVQMVI